MAVPDWPTTYGYNMFLFPVRLWGMGTGIFYEHSHRLFASFVGMLTTILAIWLWVREPRAWLRWLGVAAFLAVVLQGVLGGLRVTLLKDEIGIVHAALAQTFLVLVTGIALAASGRMQQWAAQLQTVKCSGHLRGIIVAATGLIFVQLILGATMRHQHAGLAVPDFPLAYGQVWPPMDAAFVERVNQARVGVQEFQPITAFGIGLHMTHRLVALLIVSVVGAVACLAWREWPRAVSVRRLALGWFGLISLQAALGAATVWSNKAADVATAHVVLGALSLLSGAILTAVSFPARAAQRSQRAVLASGLARPTFAQPRRTTA